MEQWPHLKSRVYSAEQRDRIVDQACEVIRSRYMDDPNILGIYIGGSAHGGSFGSYDRPIHVGTPAERSGSDIDAMLVITDRPKSTPLTVSDQSHYGVRELRLYEGHDTILYRVVDAQGNDVLFHGIHPIELLIMTEDLFDGFLSGRYEWGNEQSGPRSFAQEVRGYEIIKESDALREIRQRYVQ